MNGVNGRNFIGPNGGTIFLPAAGYNWDGKLHDTGSYGIYWSSTPSYEGYSSELYFNSGEADWDGKGLHLDELSVRPVR